MSFLNSIIDAFSDKKNKNIEQSVCAVIVAAGSSSRMQGENKLLMELSGMPVIALTLFQFEKCEYVDEIVIVCREEDILPYGAIVKNYDIKKVKSIITGGRTRTHSSLLGVLECSKDVKLVAIHDGARPFVSEEIISNTIELAAKTGAAAPAVPLKDSIKVVENNVAVKNVDRSTIMAVQTPQIFDKDLINAALTRVINEKLNITDDCAAVELMGVHVNITEGSYDNIKITTPSDIYVGNAILNWREEHENWSRV